jgi:glycolate oxidase
LAARHPQGFHSADENYKELGASLENGCLCDERGSWPRESKAWKHPKHPSSCFKSNGAFLNKIVDLAISLDCSASLTSFSRMERTKTRATAAARELKRKLGDQAVVTDAVRLVELGGDKWFAHRQPDFAVFPGTKAEVAEVMRVTSEKRLPVTTRGSGYGYVGGCVPVLGGVVLGTQRMNRIKEINNADFVAVVEPAVITGELQSAVRRKGLFYPPDPASLQHCSLGGNIATNAGGPRCLKYGVTRNYVLGLEVVLANGAIVSCGGRTHKNKTGFDLVGLFVGSEGLLGIVTEATLRLLPFPPARAVLSAGFRDMRAASQAIRVLFAAGFLPAAVEIADRFTLEAARQFRPGNSFPPGDAHLLIEVDGQRESVHAEARFIARLLRAEKAMAIEKATDEMSCARLWKLRRAFSESLRATGLKKLNEDVVVPRGRLVDLVDFARELQARSGFPIACFGHAGDGNIHVNIMVPNDDEPEIHTRAESALDELFAKVIAWGGAITGEHGVGLAKMRWWDLALSEENRALHQSVKDALDPQRLLNPGKFV